jgi:hypothetical protein
MMRGLSRRDWLILAAAGILFLAAWLLPRPKAEAVAGRLDYLQFLLALLATGLLATVALVWLAPPARRRRTAFRATALWLGIGTALLVCEAIAALLPARHLMDNPWYLFSDQGVTGSNDLPFERPPHLHWEGLSRGDLAILHDDADPYATRVAFVTDHQGFRNSKDLERADLIFIGDSFTEAGNIPEDDTFVQKTAAALGRSVRNLGRAGYTGPTELLVLRKYGLTCRPRMVVWQLTESNDLIEAAVYQDWVQAGRPPYQRLLPQRQPRSSSSWQVYSPTWRLFSCLREPRPWPLRGTFKDGTGRVHEIRILELPAQAHSPVDHPGWPMLADSLREGAQLLRAEKIPLLVLHIPMKPRGLGPRLELQPELAAEVGRYPDIPEPMTLAFHLQKLCDELGIPFVDATPLLRRAAAAGELVYQPFDTHLSVEGHRVVTAALVEQLRKLQK